MKSFSCKAVLLFLAACQVRDAMAAFSASSLTSRASSSNSMMKSASQLNMAKDSFGEGSRQFRRTVYSHDDWVKHRSSDRFVRNLASFTNSGVYANLAKEVIATTTVSAFVVVWNAIFGDYQDLLGNFHPGPLKDSIIPILSLPLTPFTLSSSSLGLLLTFRANTAYKRWDEARKNWGMNINHTRDLVRMGNAYYDRSAVSEEQAESDLKNLALCTWAFVRSMKRHLSPEWEDEEAFKWELKEKLPNEQAERIINAAHRPNRALQDLSVAIENLPMHFFRKNEIHAAATIFEDNLGSSERLLTSPIPLFYQRHTSRFISIWLLLLPLALWEPFKESWNHIDMIPATTMLSLLLFGIDEIGIQLEEPFTILPMQAFCDKIYNWCNEIVSFKPGDNGMPVYQYGEYFFFIDDGIVSFSCLYVIRLTFLSFHVHHQITTVWEILQRLPKKVPLLNLPLLQQKVFHPFRHP